MQAAGGCLGSAQLSASVNDPWGNCRHDPWDNCTPARGTGQGGRDRVCPANVMFATSLCTSKVTSIQVLPIYIVTRVLQMIYRLCNDETEL